MDRFDLEIEIAKLHSISEDIRDITKGIAKDELDSENCIKVLEGLAALVSLKVSNLTDVYMEVFYQDCDAYGCCSEDDEEDDEDVGFGLI